MAKTIAHQSANLVHQVEQREQDELEKAQVDYIDALYKESGTPADADKLRDDAIRLGKRAGDIHADYSAIVGARQLATSIHSLAGCVVVAERLSQAVQRSVEAVRQQMQLLTAQRDALMRLATTADDLTRTDARLRKELLDAKIAAPELLARVTIPDAGLINKPVTIESLLPAFADWRANYLAVKPSTDIVELVEPTPASAAA